MKTGIGTSGFGLRCSFADPAVHTADERPCCPIGSSGKRRQNPGRRYVGGHLYDSVLGVTCHVCRQKAIEDHVLCSKCARAFCRRCMRTRHGEDLDIEVKYDHWVCPKCRGGCGPGCVDCCNCSKCRQQHGLAPTKISAALLQASGFDNVHDYLIHLRTKESAAAILARKLGKKWCRSHLERPGAAESLRLLVACSCKKASISNNPVSSPPRATKEEVPGIRQPDEARNPWNPKATATNGVAGSSKARQSPLNPNSGIPKDHTHSNVGGVRGASSKAPVSPNSSIPSDYTHPNVRMSEPWTVDYSSPAKFMSRVQETTDHRDDYKRGLEMLLAAPYDPIELRNKWKSIRCRKPICRSVETRARSYDMESTTLGRSYMDHYPGMYSISPALVVVVVVAALTFYFRMHLSCLLSVVAGLKFWFLLENVCDFTSFFSEVVSDSRTSITPAYPPFHSFQTLHSSSQKPFPKKRSSNYYVVSFTGWSMLPPRVHSNHGLRNKKTRMMNVQR